MSPPSPDKNDGSRFIHHGKSLRPVLAGCFLGGDFLEDSLGFLGMFLEFW